MGYGDALRNIAGGVNQLADNQSVESAANVVAQERWHTMVGRRLNSARVTMQKQEELDIRQQLADQKARKDDKEKEDRELNKANRQAWSKDVHEYTKRQKEIGEPVDPAHIRLLGIDHDLDLKDIQLYGYGRTTEQAKELESSKQTSRQESINQKLTNALTLIGKKAGITFTRDTIQHGRKKELANLKTSTRAAYDSLSIAGMKKHLGELQEEEDALRSDEDLDFDGYTPESKANIQKLTSLHIDIRKAKRAMAAKGYLGE